VLRGVSIRLFLADGNPSGLWVVEKSGWTGIGLMWPRALHASARQRPELQRPGVYVLVGPGESSGRPRVYVGEADILRKRLDQHQASKDFWTRAIAFTAKDASLNKAHVKYLEGRLLSLANQARRAEVDNGNVPQLPALSEPDIADVEAFLDELLLLYPVLDVRVFEPLEEAAASGTRLQLTGPGADGQGAETAEGFVVFAGSRARSTEVPSIHQWLSELRSRLVESGVVELGPDGLRFTQDYVFESPSAAAGTLLGRAANGRTEWKDAQGNTLKQIQASVAAT
jgi:hypothetical protein